MFLPYATGGPHTKARLDFYTYYWVCAKNGRIFNSFAIFGRLEKHDTTRGAGKLV